MIRVRAPQFSWSVRTRILAAIFVVTALGMVTAGTTAYLVQRDRVMQDVDEQLLHSLDAVRGVVLGGDENDPSVETSPDTAAPETAAPETAASETATPESDPPSAEVPEAESPDAGRFTDVETALGEVLARVLPGPNESSLGLINGVPRFISIAETSFHLEDDTLFLERVIAETADGSARMGTYSEPSDDNGDLRYIATPITVGGDERRALFVTAIDLDASMAEISTAFRTYSWVAAASLVLVTLVGWFVAGRLLRPIRLLRDTASRITASDLRERIPVRGNDDVSALTATVNDMLARLNSSIEAQSQLLDDVRHELKTPLTIVRGHLELLDAHDSQDVDETRTLVIDELDRMTRLIDDIESLVSTQQLQSELAPTDVAELCQQVFAKVRAIRGHEWRLDLGDVPEGAIAEIDGERITQALLQLTDNAAKYSPEGTPITLGAAHDGMRVRFWVADKGPGIPEESQRRIFERLGRVDTGRGIEGSGLGLPIVEAIAQSHGGRVVLDSSPKGSTFTLELPLIAKENESWRASW